MEQKTQISALVNGSLGQILNNDKDYSALPRQCHEGRHAGSSYADSDAIWVKVLAENPTALTIELFGETYVLERKSSLSGKSVWYSTSLTREQAALLAQEDPRYMPKQTEGYRLTISDARFVNVCINPKKGISKSLCPSLVTIL